ncbi:bifunctional tetrahydrofolate synthase/dihydrofolate synthase [Methylotenera sp.]|uniref:bifunctional tetrahydrofolate synthase/dihydrofolate synthase n=3 Tax=Methylotenera sp. TaxID=2051956 RepID=UPI0027263C4B|nr:bifunctional tetrahydrofolate synthase/dihydrofolate synthase [Methylotenera sp.]MDO9206034.1 bifunctional tetrahydrofolate synthase/dihydrofolate synthase [Methylotenera sp.]MDP1522693.1 bifunctional tetrahydrofolate synthase/dihydrofolate synthase [Methylotenera sp.]MDP2071872.1 bifunctional tetrahydrofolate synthase/dihydrofolate synthase [Methylotenera sp.]MDP2230789.1 bifunctional tetrahydrofolate synthase/dihydrofolate synthase [Methylotenera sp.]MDP3005497.1 bifunctional tetrahydrofo
MSESTVIKNTGFKNIGTKNLDAWLSYIERLHPKSIAMGLDRVKLIIDRLKLQPNFIVITVAGTNGKGSTCAMLEQIYKNAGYVVGCYTSPHLLRYNERVRVNGDEVSNDSLCAAFEAIDAARLNANGDLTALTYFEVGTLAAIWHFMQTGIDVAILEVGLGGRLDAVNAFEPSCAIVTSVDLDHQEFLGNTRESIGFEKAGVYRTSVPAICGDDNPPASLVAHAHKIQADFMCIHQDFDFILDIEDLSVEDLSIKDLSIKNKWRYVSGTQAAGTAIYNLPLPALQGRYQLNNAACAIAAVESLQSSLPVAEVSIASAMHQVSLVGRFQTISKSPYVILDVAHNPHAAHALADNLKASKLHHDKTIAVFAMLADKDVKGVVEAVKNEIDIWYVASIDHLRGAVATDLAGIVTEVNPHAEVKTFENADNAFQQACIDAGENDKIVVFGSFFTVSSVMQAINDRSKN